MGTTISLITWAVCGLLLTALAPWQVLGVAGLVLGALVAGVYFDETSED